MLAGRPHTNSQCTKYTPTSATIAAACMIGCDACVSRQMHRMLMTARHAGGVNKDGAYNIIDPRTKTLVSLLELHVAVENRSG